MPIHTDVSLIGFAHCLWPIAAGAHSGSRNGYGRDLVPLALSWGNIGLANLLNAAGFGPRLDSPDGVALVRHVLRAREVRGRAAM